MRIVRSLVIAETSSAKVPLHRARQLRDRCRFAKWWCFFERQRADYGPVQAFCCPDFASGEIAPTKQSRMSCGFRTLPLDWELPSAQNHGGPSVQAIGADLGPFRRGSVRALKG